MSTYKPPDLKTLRDIPPATSSLALMDIQSTDSDASTTKIIHRDLRGLVGRYASTLAEKFDSSSVVAIVMHNSVAFVISFLATTSAALIAAPLNPAYTEDEFSFYLEDSDARVVLITEGMSADSPIRKAADKRNIEIMEFPSELIESSWDSTTDFDNTYPSQAPNGDTIALFLHTSGTTSRPKGVPLSHTNLVTSVCNIATTYELTEADRSLLVMPLFHVHGLMAATLTTLATGGCLIIPPGGKFSASKFWSSAQIGEATWYTAVPTMHQILLSRADKEYNPEKAPKLRFIRSCSASLAPSVMERLESRFGASVLEAYAMTEAAHQMTSNPLPKHGPRAPGTVGIAQRVEVAILDDQNRVLKPGEIGEVCIRGQNVTKGYHNNEEANKSAFAGGWFHTGDQGWLSDEGYLTLTGRIKELVNRGGEKISPLEVDAALLAHADVKEAVSFAVPDEKYGEEVNAAVILKEGSTLDSDQLTAFAKERLAVFKIPKRFFISDDLPRTATGKIQRRIVAKHFLEKAEKE